MKTLLTKESLPAAIGIIVIIVTSYLLFDMSRDTSDAIPQVGGSGMPTSLSQLLASTDTQRCTFTSPSEAGMSKGEFFIAHGSMRGNFEAEMNSASGLRVVKSYMVIDRGYTYVWADAASMGAKISVEAMHKAEERGGSEGGPIGLNQKVNYQCAPWSPDDAFFATPKNITFMDMTSMSQEPAPTSAGGTGVVGTPASGGMTPAQVKALQCKTCEQAGPQIAECKKAFACTE